MQLFIELSKVSSSFMVDESIGNQPYIKTVFDDSDAVLNVLSHTGNDVATDGFIDFSGSSHIEAARMKLSGMLFSSSYSTGSKQRGHGVADRFLNG
mgnify:CR=1 FL=1